MFTKATGNSMYTLLVDSNSVWLSSS